MFASSNLLLLFLGAARGSAAELFASSIVLRLPATSVSGLDGDAASLSALTSLSRDLLLDSDFGRVVSLSELLLLLRAPAALRRSGGLD